MPTRATLAFLAILGTSCASVANAQEKTAPFKSLDELHASYTKQLWDLDRKRIVDLTKLAASQSVEEAAATYRELFGLAVARELYVDAEPAAILYMKSGAGDPQDRALAALVTVIALANRGEYDQSLATLSEFFQQHPVTPDPQKRVEPSTAIALGEAYLQLLIRGGRYDIAKKAGEMVIARRPEPEVRSHFQARLKRLDMLGKPATEIIGRDVDGRQIKLSDLKGNVVLVDFWATWCPPCVTAMPELQAVQAKFEDQGFVILGVNLDAHRDDVDGLAKATPIVKEFLLHTRASWPNILLGEPLAGDPTESYGVDEIPASFLISREGKVVHVELRGADLEKAIATLLKTP